MRVDKPKLTPRGVDSGVVSGKSKQDKKKRDAHVADLTQPPPPAEWVDDQEASDPAWDDTQLFPLPGFSLDVQIVQRLRRHPQSSQLVDFCVSIQVREPQDEAWCDIERVDCQHGYVHVDRQAPGGSSTKDVDCVPAKARDNLDQALAWSLDYIWDLEERLKGWV